MLDNTKQLLMNMSEEKVEANPQSFAAVFECIERSSVEDKLEILEYYKKQMDQKVCIVLKIFIFLLKTDL